MARTKRARPELEREGQIRCRYCGGFYDPALEECPNCGNRTEENQSYATDWKTIGPEECAGGFGGSEHMIRRTATWLAVALVVMLIVVGIAGVTRGMSWSAKAQNTRPSPTIQADSSAEPKENTGSTEAKATDDSRNTPEQTRQPETQIQGAEVKSPDAITLNYTDITMQPEEALTLKATLTPKDWNGKVKWTTDNEYVVWPDQEGNLHCFGGGSCVITAHAGTLTATCQVRCSGAEADHTLVNLRLKELKQEDAKALFQILQKSGQKQASAEQTDRNKADTQPQKTKPEKTPGTGEAEEEPEKPEEQGEDVTLGLTDVTLMAPGHTYQCEVTGGDGNYTWSSGGEWVATVDQNGVVTAVGSGFATISCTDGSGKSASCTVHVP